MNNSSKSMINTQVVQQTEKPTMIYVILGLIIFLAVSIRLYINFHNQLMPGINAIYHPVQVRALLETGQLGFPDFPLLFYLEAGLAKIMQIFTSCDLSNCIMFSAKIIDSLLYPLIAIPTFLLARAVVGKEGPRWIPLVISALTTISAFTFIMMADFQKNALGLLWSMFFIYFLYQGTSEGKAIDYFWAGLFFILTGLTHLGALGFIIAFSVSFLFFSFIFKRERRIDLIKMALLLFLAVVSVLAFLFFFDPGRWETLTSVIMRPLKIFAQPIIVGMLNGQIPLMPPLIFCSLVANSLAILGLILLVKKRKEIPVQEKTLLLASLLVTIFLVFPFLGTEWANRLYLMAYLPASLILILLLKYIYKKWLKILLAVLALIIMIIPTPIVIIVRGAPSISEDAYRDLLKLKTEIIDPSKTLIITRHGLEWWTAWLMKVDVAQGWGLTEKDVDKYHDIYYLKQKSGHGNFGPLGPGGPSFPEVEIPSQSKIVYEDEFFILAKALPGFLQYYQKEKKRK